MASGSAVVRGRSKDKGRGKKRKVGEGREVEGEEEKRQEFKNLRVGKGEEGRKA